MTGSRRSTPTSPGARSTTRPVQFSGRHLFVNADARAGDLTAEVLDGPGKLIEGLSAAECVPVRADKTKQAVTWKEGDLAARPASRCGSGST